MPVDIQDTLRGRELWGQSQEARRPENAATQRELGNLLYKVFGYDLTDDTDKHDNRDDFDINQEAFPAAFSAKTSGVEWLNFLSENYQTAISYYSADDYMEMAAVLFVSPNMPKNEE